MEVLTNIIFYILRFVIGSIGLTVKIFTEAITVFAGIIKFFGFIVSKIGQLFLAIGLFGYLGVDFAKSITSNHDLIFIAAGGLMAVSGILVSWFTESGQFMLYEFADLCIEFALGSGRKR